MTATRRASPQSTNLSRREFVRQCALHGLALAAAPLIGCRGLDRSRAAAPPAAGGLTLPLEGDWLFGGKLDPAALKPSFDDGAFARVTLPHCVTRLSWQGWDPAAWQGVWVYRRHFSLPRAFGGMRVFVHFEGVMVGATPVINGHELPQHLGGYLPFGYELTPWLLEGRNILAIAVDSRWSNVPPQGAPVGPKRIDYLEPGGIYRPVRLEAVPPVFICDVFAKPVRVLEADRRIEVRCVLDAAITPAEEVEIQIELRDGPRRLARACQAIHLESVGRKETELTLDNLGNIRLWDVEAPQLYEVVATLSIGGRPVHSYRVRTGLREARFERDGFFLNGRRLQLFGLNRHELFPYLGGAMPRRVMRRDAEILRHEFNCNMVRCSHYPQSAAFLDACDELGLLVWEEVPGWGYLGDDAWKELLVRDVHDMIVRDRNRPAIVIWGTRVNESANDVELYRRTRAVAKALDDSRPTSGSMTPGSKKNWQKEWHEDVFAFDDYHAAADGTVGIAEPVPGVPYLLAEAVGQFNYSKGKNFDAKYRRAGEVALQQQQALRHAQAHSNASRNPRICGVIAWCAFDYGSLVNPHNNVKCPGVADVFRIPKLGASFYLAQTDPNRRPIIQPNFYWDFGPATPQGPGRNVAIFSNCDWLELSIEGRHHATLRPDRENHPHLPHPPFFTDLVLDGSTRPELRIDGYVGERLVLTRRFSSDPTEDQLRLETDDTELIGDGADATRLVFRVTDKFGAERAFGGGEVRFQVRGPGEIVGDNPFSLTDSGGVGAIWIKTRPNSAGRIRIQATHDTLGSRTVTIRVRQPGVSPAPPPALRS